MSKFQIRRFFREFPWLYDLPIHNWAGEPNEWCEKNNCQQTGWHTHEWLNPREVEGVSVARISEELLAKKATRYSVDGECVAIDERRQIFLLNQDGIVITAVEEEWEASSMACHVDDTRTEGETIGESLLWIDPNDVSYIVSVESGYTIQNHFSQKGCRVTVYKPPKGFTLKGWVDEQLRCADEILQAMIAEIDAEGGKI